MGTFQLLRAGNGKIVRSASGRPFGNNVSVAVSNFANGSRRRMPYAVSRDLQPAVIAGKELYFRVTHSDLRTVANGGLSQTGVDFQFETTTGAVVPYIVKSYDPVAGTLFGVFKNNLAGSAAATRGYLYFNHPAWTASRQDALNTLPNCLSCLFLPSGVDHSDAGLDFSGNLPTSDKVLVNPGALVNGSTDYIWRTLGSPITTFLISIYCQDLDANSDNALYAFGLEGGSTVIFIRRLFGTAAGVTGGETNAWRFGWVTTEPGASVTSASFYETANNTSGTGLQHVAIRRFVDGSDPEIYLNGVLSPLAFKSTPLVANAAQRGPIATTGQRLLLGRGSVATRFWHGYLDCFKFYSGSNKSAAWAKSEYTNLLDIDGSVVFGDPETVSTATMFGETVDIACNGLANVVFPADKYVINDIPVAGALPATPSIQSLTQPAGGSLAVTTGNNVRYTNTSNTDPDNGGAVRLTNGTGTVLVPIRATITPSVPPVGGYYKVPNILVPTPKTAVIAGSLGAAGTPNTLLWAFAQFTAGTFHSSTHYIKITGPINGGAKGQDINVTVGGTATHPLVIMSDAPAGANNWTSRGSSKVKDCCLRLKRPWTWVYGVWSEMLPTAAGVWNTTGETACVLIEADNSFVTACKQSASQCTLSLDHFDGCNISYNWWEVSCQSANPTGETLSDFGFRSHNAGASALPVTNATIMYNYCSDHAIQITPTAKNFRGIIIGIGLNDGGLRHPSTGTEIGFNFLDASMSHTMEFKCIPDWVHHNHGTGKNSVHGGLNTRGWGCDGVAIGVAHRPLFQANRITSAVSNIEGGFADYVSNWLVNAAGAVFGTGMAVTPFGQGQPRVARNIAGGDGCRFVGNKCNLVLGDSTFEPFPPQNYVYGDLNNRGPGVVSAHVGGTIKDNAGALVSGDPVTGTHAHLVESATRIKPALIPGFTVETPPVLTAALAGPGVTGKTWGT